MTPNLLQNNADAILKIYADAEEVMLGKIAKRLSQGKEQSFWSMKKYAEIVEFQKEMRNILRDLERDSSEMRDDMIEKAYNSGADSFEREYRELGKDISAIPGSRLSAIADLQHELSERFDAQNSLILRDVNDTYRSIIGNVVSMMSTGVYTSGEALKLSLNNFADRGITGFVDRAGRKWQMDSYADMAVRTGMMHAALQGYLDDALAHGEDLVIVTDHQDSCPLCAEWERAVLSLTGEMLDHPDCDGLLSDAQAGGLFHPNCGHSVTVYVPGLTRKAGSKDDQGYTRAQNDIGYKDRQLQRYYENNVRRWKRRQAVAITPEEERYCQAYVQRWQSKIRHLVDNYDLPRKYNREGGRVKLSDAARKLGKYKIGG